MFGYHIPKGKVLMKWIQSNSKTLTAGSSRPAKKKAKAARALQPLAHEATPTKEALKKKVWLEKQIPTLTLD
jgi:hypothetical protein